MSIRATVEALQALHATIEGIRRAPVKLPISLQAADLPTVVVWPGPTPTMEGWIAAAHWYESKRIYHVRVFVSPTGEGADYDQAHQHCITLLQRFGEAYMRGVNQNLGGVITSLGPPITDSGITRLAYLDNVFHGFELRLTVSRKQTTE